MANCFECRDRPDIQDWKHQTCVPARISGRRSPQPGIGIKYKDGKMLYEKNKRYDGKNMANNFLLQMKLMSNPQRNCKQK